MRRGIIPIALASSTVFALLGASLTTAEEVTDEQAQQTIEAWENNNQSTSGAAAQTSSGTALRNAPQRTTELYRGSFLMWANERVSFSYSGGRVIHSNGWQESGAVFPNNVTTHGTSNVLALANQHQWRGTYTVGAGVPTPWGDANVYNMTSTARTNVNGNGSWNAWWVD